MDRNGTAEAVLNTVGLDLGVTPSSANLEVGGNMMASGTLSLGGDNPSGSNLHLHGTLGSSFQAITSNATAGEHSIIIADTSSGEVSITIPAASSHLGKRFSIKKSSSAGNLVVTSTDLMDDHYVLRMDQDDSTILPYIHLISDASQWHILDAMGASGDISSENLILHLKLDESSGLVSNDETGSSVGTLTNMTGSEWSSNGAKGGALEFDGSEDHVTHTVTRTTPKGSFSHWIYPHQLRRMVTIYESDGDASGTYNGFADGNVLEIHLGIEADGRVNFTYQDGPDPAGRVDVWSTNTLSPNNWYHVSATWDTDNAFKVYLNGEHEDTIDVTAKTFARRSPTTEMQIGRVGDGQADRHWDGLIDEVRFYDKVLSAEEVRQLYLASEL